MLITSDPMFQKVKKLLLIKKHSVQAVCKGSRQGACKKKWGASHNSQTKSTQLLYTVHFLLHTQLLLMTGVLYKYSQWLMITEDWWILDFSTKEWNLFFYPFSIYSVITQWCLISPGHPALLMPGAAVLPSGQQPNRVSEQLLIGSSAVRNRSTMSSSQHPSMLRNYSARSAHLNSKSLRIHTEPSCLQHLATPAVLWQ